MQSLILTILVNFLCKLHRASDTQIAVKTFLSASVWVFPEDITIRVCELSKEIFFTNADVLHPIQGLNRMKRQKGKFCMHVHWYIQVLIPLDIIAPGSQSLRHRLTALSPLILKSLGLNGSTSSALMGLQLADSRPWNYHSHMSQSHIINLFPPMYLCLC